MELYFWSGGGENVALGQIDKSTVTIKRGFDTFIVMLGVLYRLNGVVD